jgi:GT2 family glycosyltransferase
LSLAIIIVNFNSASLLKKNLSFLINNKNLKRGSIIIVDNGEFYKGKRISLRRALRGLSLEKIKFLINSKNKGFGYACNQGVKQTGEKNILFLNPDCAIKDKDIRRLVKLINSSEKNGIVSPRLFKEDGKEQRWSFAEKSDIWSVFLNRKENKDNQKKFLSNKNVEWTSGACLMIKRTVFKQVGGFDPRFFLYFEDRDLCWRVKKVGYRIIVCAKSKAVHAESQSFISWGQRKKYYYESQNYFFKKRYGFFFAFLMKILRIPYYIKNVYLSK